MCITKYVVIIVTSGFSGYITKNKCTEVSRISVYRSLSYVCCINYLRNIVILRFLVSDYNALFIFLEIPITPYCVCQRNNKDSQKKPLAWIFSIFTTIICIIFPVTSFSADVAFYITCSDHYNHTAQLLANVTAGMEVVYHTAPPTDYLHMDEAGHVRAASPIKTYLSTIQSTPTQYPPAPLLANGAIPDYNLIAPSENAIPLFDGRTARSNITLNSIFVNSETITKGNALLSTVNDYIKSVYVKLLR